MQAGDLNHYVEIQERTTVRATDGSGDQVEAIVTLFPVWAKIEGVSVKDLVASRQNQAQVSHRVVMRWADVNTIELGPRYRLLCEGKIYRIIGALPDNQTGREYVTLLCESGAFKWQDQT